MTLTPDPTLIELVRPYMPHATQVGLDALFERDAELIHVATPGESARAQRPVCIGVWFSLRRVSLRSHLGTDLRSVLAAGRWRTADPDAHFLVQGDQVPKGSVLVSWFRLGDGEQVGSMIGPSSDRPHPLDVMPGCHFFSDDTEQTHVCRVVPKPNSDPALTEWFSVD